MNAPYGGANAPYGNTAYSAPTSSSSYAPPPPSIPNAFGGPPPPPGYSGAVSSSSSSSYGGVSNAQGGSVSQGQKKISQAALNNGQTDFALGQPMVPEIHSVGIDIYKGSDGQYRVAGIPVGGPAHLSQKIRAGVSLHRD